MGGVQVRPAEAADIAALAELKEQWAGLPEPLTPERRGRFGLALAEWMDAQGPSVIARVAVSDARVVGMAWLVVFDRVPNVDQLVRRSGDVQSVFVLPEMRGRGIGRALVTALLDEADRLGVDRVTVSSNEASRGLYAGVGFRVDESLLERRRGSAS